MSVNWVRFPCCSAGPTSAALISSNISQNHSTPISAIVQNCVLQVHTENSTALSCHNFYPRNLPHNTHNSEAGSENNFCQQLPEHCVLVAAKLKGATGSRQSSGSTISASQRPLSCGPSYQRDVPIASGSP